MENKPTVLVGGDVTGNIGSCEVKSSNFSVSSFYTETVAVNSCTGEVVSQNIYYDWSYIYFPAALIFIIVAIFVSLRVAFD
jgi:hypothetical protein